MNDFINQLDTWFTVFMVYSFAGWVFEELVGYVLNHKFSNRGFLIGPICPIYGFGALLITFALGDAQNIIAIFCVSMVGSVLLEYFTSYLMEKLFHARWWDYRDNAFNLNGRICLSAALMFGLLGVVIVRITNPALLEFLGSMTPELRAAISLILLGILVGDAITSLWMVIGFRVTVGTVAGDATEEISARVREIMMQKGRLNRRLVKAFPSAEAKPQAAKPKTKRTRKAKRATKSSDHSTPLAKSSK